MFCLLAAVLAKWFWLISANYNNDNEKNPSNFNWLGDKMKKFEEESEQKLAQMLQCR